MLCEICFEEIKNSIVGVTNKGNETGKRVSLSPKGYFVLSGDNSAIPLYIEAEKPITKGNNKGKMKNIEAVIFIKASFCAKCGEKIIKDEILQKREVL